MNRQISLRIFFDTISTHEDLLSALVPTMDLKRGDRLKLEIDLNGSGIINSELVLILAAKLDSLRIASVFVETILLKCLPDSKGKNYAGGTNFLTFLGINPEQIESTAGIGQDRCIEFSKFDKTTIYKVFDSIMRILMVNGVNEDMLVVLHFCLNEILDNTLNHSSPKFTYGAGTGFVLAQFLQREKEIRILIVDTGQGIHAALTGHPKSRFKKLTESEAVLRCIEKGVTNSLGLGFGLWATSQMMIKNKGDFKILSGNSCLTNGKLKASPTWKGTLNFLRINTETPVDYKEIFGENSDQYDMFQEFKESQFGNLENLW